MPAMARKCHPSQVLEKRRNMASKKYRRGGRSRHINGEPSWSAPNSLFKRNQARPGPPLSIFSSTSSYHHIAECCEPATGSSLLLLIRLISGSMPACADSQFHRDRRFSSRYDQNPRTANREFSRRSARGSKPSWSLPANLSAVPEEFPVRRSHPCARPKPPSSTRFSYCGRSPARVP